TALNKSRSLQQLNAESLKAPNPSVSDNQSFRQHSVFQPFRQEFQTADGQLSPYLQLWAAALARERNIPLPVIVELLQQVRYDPQVIRLMTPKQGARGKKSWPTYQKRFVDEVRI